MRNRIKLPQLLHIFAIGKLVRLVCERVQRFARQRRPVLYILLPFLSLECLRATVALERGGGGAKAKAKDGLDMQIRFSSSLSSPGSKKRERGGGRGAPRPKADSKGNT